MSKSVDEIIREAMERGVFKDLPNKGKKLNLDDYFDTPEDFRLGYSVLKNADFIPEEVLLLKEIGVLQDQLVSLPEGEERKRIIKEIEHRRLKYNLLMDRFKRNGSV